MIATIRNTQRKVGDAVQPFVLLVLRLIIGYGFLRSGYLKITHLEQTTKFFANIGIPMPEINAMVSSVFEMVCGTAVMLGLATRVASAIGIFILLVAIVTNHLDQVSKLFSEPGVFIVAAPIPYMMLFLMFISVGPGKLSLDQVLALESDDR